MRRRRTRRGRFGAAALLAGVHALLFALAFPPFNLWPLALVAIAPLVAIALRTAAPRGAALIVWAASLPVWLFHQRWLIDVTLAGYPMLCAYLALYPALFVWIGARLSRRMSRATPLAVALALLWTGLETLRGEAALTGYAWFLIAHPLIDTPIAQLAEWIGVYGVGFLIALAQTLAVAGLMRRGRRAEPARVVAAISAAVGILLLAAGAGLMAERMAERRAGQTERRVNIAVVQTNVPQSNKIGWPIEQRIRDFARMRELTIDAATTPDPNRTPSVSEGMFNADGRDARPTRNGSDRQEARPTGNNDGRDAHPTDPALDLIVWPETMFPGETLSPDGVLAMREAGLLYGDDLPADAFFNVLLAIQEELSIPMLIGAIGYDGLRIAIDDDRVDFSHDGKFNSAFLIAGGAVAPDRYDKLHLTPFGEVIPIISRVAALERLLLSIGAPGMAFDLDPGAAPTVIESPLTASPGDAGPPPLRMATPICFEAATPRICRRLVFGDGARRADLMVNLTNDGWFGAWSGGREQHLQVSRWRCVELRTPMLRAANTGISSYVDTLGVVNRAGPDGRQETVNVDGVMRASVALPIGGPTLYARTGDGAGWLALIASIALTLWIALPAAGRAQQRQEH